jgi:hypothetical protein
VISLLVLARSGAAQPKAWDCYRGEVHAEPRWIADFLIRFQPVADKKAPGISACQAQVFSSQGPVFQATDHAMSIDDVSGKDINGDGKPDVVFEGYSGEAHCCWTYWVVSLGDRPGLLKEVHNQTATSFRETTDGHIDFWTGDGAFDDFDCLSHAETVFPTVFLRLQGRELKDVGAEHWDDYVNQVAQARKNLTADESRQFREAKNQDELCEGNPRATIPKVLTIVFADLYGGREEEAWKALDAMWPAADKGRIRQLILQKRKEGILRYTRPVTPRKKR